MRLSYNKYEIKKSNLIDLLRVKRKCLTRDSIKRSLDLSDFQVKKCLRQLRKDKIVVRVYHKYWGLSDGFLS